MGEQYEIVKGFLDGIRPEPRLSVWEWADKYRYLDSTSSAEPGIWRTSRVPYMRKIMEYLSVTNPVQEVIFMKGAQIAATEVGFNFVGYIIDVAPAPTLYVMPTVDTSKRNSKQRLDPTIKATPRLREKIAPARSRDSGNTVLQKDFPGGTLVMTGANSAAGLRSMPARFLILDEADAYPTDLEGEGSPVDLARARTRTFAKKKIYMPSTPTLKGASVVESEFDDTEQQYYHVPCPHCEHLQILVFENLKWEENRPETVMYFCEECGAGIEERHKPWMLREAGYGGLAEWRSTKPEKETDWKVGLHLSSLYSPLGWYSWEQAVRDWIKAQGKPEKEKTFINTVLGKTYELQGDAPAWEHLYNHRREAYRINVPPKEVVFLTAGVDVQKDRIELEVVGWYRGLRAYSIDYRVLLGDTSEEAVWDELEKVVHETWKREDGAEMRIMKMGVDTGYNTNQVYRFCKRFDQLRVIPIKGGPDSQQIMVTNPKQVHITKSGKKIGKTKVWQIGVGVIKSELYSFLKREKKTDGTLPIGYCHFPQYEENYFRGITAEELQRKKNNKGYVVFEWVKKYERNEPLDCRVYARAMASLVGIDRHGDNEVWWESMEPYKAPVENTTPKKQRDRGPSIWDR